MEKKGKKYLIKESELKEIVREMMLMELFNPDDYKHLYTPGYQGSPTLPKDYIKGAWNLLKGIPNIVIPDSWKEAAANGNGDIAQYILSLLGAQMAGTAGADFVPHFGLRSGEGPNPDAHQQLHVNAAANWLRSNAGRRTSGSCAKYVRIALNRGGIQVPHGMRAPSAKYYYNILKANGWEEIPVNQAGELCDVVVISPCVDSLGTGHPDGHIAMCIGNGMWASDFIQKNMYGLRGMPPSKAVHVFRYKNRVQ
jgi:hypothetical protein